MGKIGESMLFVAMGIAIVGLFLFFPTLKTTGNVVADYEYKANIGDAIDYSINIDVPESGVDVGTPILVSLSKDGKIFDSQIVNMGDFVKMSDNSATLTDGQVVPFGIYSVEANKIINYKFDKTGEYELYFAIFKLDIMRTIKITVE